MTEKRQKQITLLAIILGLLTLSFIVVASSGLVYMTLVTPVPEHGVITVNKTEVIQLGGTSINWETSKPLSTRSKPYPTLNKTEIAELRIMRSTQNASRPRRPDFPTPEPIYIKTVKQLGGIDAWGKTLGVILVLMLISSLMLFTRISKQEG